MAKKSSEARDRKRARLIQLKWDKRQSLKKIISNPATSDEDRLVAQKKLNQLPRNSSRVRARNRCAFTGRSRGYLSKFNMSRICFREMAGAGLIPGIVKASW